MDNECRQIDAEFYGNSTRHHSNTLHCHALATFNNASSHFFRSFKLLPTHTCRQRAQTTTLIKVILHFTVLYDRSQFEVLQFYPMYICSRYTPPGNVYKTMFNSHVVPPGYYRQTTTLPPPYPFPVLMLWTQLSKIR